MNYNQALISSSSSLAMSLLHDDHNCEAQHYSLSQLLLGGMNEVDNATMYGNEEGDARSTSLSQIMMMNNISSPRSCVTTSLSSHMVDFSSSRHDGEKRHLNNSFECDSKETSIASKKLKTLPCQTPFKVRKEKLGDRITALHQLVSPFGKTDTASVLLEAIGYIRFLHNQIQALSSPYMGSCESDAVDITELRKRGLCLVSVSCTMHVGRDIGADFWAAGSDSGFR